MLGKVRPTTHRGNGSDPQPRAGLSEGRLALVHRYMVDAEEAEARARAAAETDEARAPQEASAAAAAREQARREAAERVRIRAEMERRRDEERVAEAPTTEPELTPPAAGETLQRVRATVTNVAPLAVEEVVKGNGRPDAREEARARKALAKADKRGAKQAAQRIAALEKREARERKALAKAAARRRSA